MADVASRTSARNKAGSRRGASRGGPLSVRTFEGAIMGDADRALERTQLDLFWDGRDVVLVNAIVVNLLERQPDRAQEALTRLKEENPGHPDLGMFDRLCRALPAEPPRPTSHAELRALIESVKLLSSTADRLLGEGARAFLLPWWQAVAHAELPSAEAEPSLRYWLGFARHHLGEEREALRLWVALCWLAPDAFEQWAPALPSVILRDGWAAFRAHAGHDDRDGPSPRETLWFPAWLALRQRWVAHLFHADEIPDTEAPLQALRLLRTLLPLESEGYSAELVQQRRRLQQSCPTFFRAYLEVVVEARRNS